MSATESFSAILLVALFLSTTAAHAHEGNLDSDGCHHGEDKGYHCH